MVLKSYNAKFNWPLTLSTQTIFVPLRRAVVENIQEQQDQGIPFELNPRYEEDLDRVVNYSLDESFRAPTPAQTRLVALMVRELGVDDYEEAFVKKVAVTEFIEKYRRLFDKSTAEKQSNEYG